MKISTVVGVALVAGLTVWACGDDDETEADRKGIGAQCTKDDECQTGQKCLAFKGGYCGLTPCTGDADCPQASACVTHEGANYCFRICIDKAECNVNRTIGVNESNCSSNTTFVSGTMGRKACIPPSSTP
jgi:hypothetical protein